MQSPIVNRSASLSPCYQIQHIPNWPESFGELPDWLYEFWFLSEEEAELGMIVYKIMCGNLIVDSGESVTKEEFTTVFETAIKAADIYCCRK